MTTTRVVGVSFDGRQGNISYLKTIGRGEKVFIQHEPENKFDKNAVKVETESGKQLGYINKHLAGTLKFKGRKQVYYSIYGGGLGKHYGIEITI